MIIDESIIFIFGGAVGLLALVLLLIKLIFDK